MKLAISRVDKTDEKGNDYKYYKIKKKFLFWYFDYTFKVYNDCYKFCIIHNNYNKFFRLEDAREAMYFLYKEDRVIKYRGYKIEKIIEDTPSFNWAYVITNKPYKETTENILYNFSKHIDVLKNRIDRYLGKKHVETVLNFTQ